MASGKLVENKISRLLFQLAKRLMAFEFSSIKFYEYNEHSSSVCNVCVCEGACFMAPHPYIRAHICLVLIMTLKQLNIRQYIFESPW